MACTLPYEECAAQAHPCFKHKMDHWRRNGVGIAPVPEGWGGPTIREQVADTISNAKANGYEPDYQGRAVLR